MLLLLAGMVSWRGVEWPLVTCALDEIQILQWLSMSSALGSEVSDFKSYALGYPHVCLRVQVADAAPHLKRIVSCFSFSDFGGLMSWSSCLPQPVPQNVGEVSVFFGQQKCQDTELRFFGDGAISPGTLQARNLVFEQQTAGHLFEKNQGIKDPNR